MAVTHKITVELRVKLKQPFGTLIKGSPEQTMMQLKEILLKEKPPKLISVGDTVTKNIHENNVPVNVSVIDNKCMRKNLQPQKITGQAVYAKNPQGTITDEAVFAIKRALESNEHVYVVVDGEEDLLTLVAVSVAPENSLIVYGQPYEGIVLVRASPQKKAEATDFLEAMQISTKS
ncbi:MAG: GTP-dependent dephospho-CoA kinase family protein [Candidatus Bathyarchaeota archaeon]|nr:GTP-dependent dephospho-CoA kinase family protein [Candidatus Bathyarchaeota archaeon]